MDDFNPDAFLAEAQAAPAGTPSAEQPQAVDIPGFNPDDFLKEAKEEQYGTPGQMLKTAAEGAAEGVLGPLAPLAEKHLLGVKDEDMLARREVNPVTHGVGQAVGLGASLFTGVGEGALLAKAGNVAKEAVGLGKAVEGLGIGAKIGAEALDQAAQAALFQGSDEISKMIINDPNASAQNAIANVGLSAALGGATGAAIGAISPLWKAAGLGSKTSKLLNEFKDEAQFAKVQPDPISAATQELNNLHSNTQELKESLYSSGLKGELLKEHLPEATPANISKITSQFDDVITKVRGAATEALDSIDTRSAAPYMEQRAKDFEAKLLQADTVEKGYNALNELKQELAKDAKAGGAFGAHPEVTAKGEIASRLAAEIKPLLEDSTVWGKAGDIQKTFNKGFSEFTGSKAEKEFLTTFGKNIGGERVLDEGKVNTFINQMGKPGNTAREKILDNYIAEHSKFADKINGVMSGLGKDHLVDSPSLNVLSKLRGEPTDGAKLYQTLVGKELDKIAGKSLATGIGGAAGSLVGAPGWGAIIGEHLLGGPSVKAMSGLAKFLVENPTSANGFKSAIDFVNAAAKGQTILNKAVDSIFSLTGKVIGAMAVSQADRDKLDKVVTKFAATPGQVQNIDNGHVGHYLPQHQSAMTESTVTAGKYLADLKPKPYRSSPLDAEIQPSDMEVARYHRALDIAQQPAVVLQHIKDGTLQPTDIQDLHTMYPAVYQQMVGQINNQLTTAQAKGQLLPYQTKIGISLFLGQPLDSSMTPSSIVAAQPQAGGAPQQGPAKAPKGEGKSMKSLGKSNSTYMTASQGAEADRSKHRGD